MILYNAGITPSFDLQGSVFARCNDYEKGQRLGNKHYLESYHYVWSQRYVDKMRANGLKIFLDSGAFSAYTKGVTIDIGEYCDYIHKNQDIILHPSVLDNIGTKDSATGTWRNQEEMERRGTSPLPCFHYGEPDEVLRYYVSKYEYITIGGMVPISTPQLILWLDHIWETVLTEADGTPKCKVHGFGLTSLPLMQRYPWYSVDSSTWVQWALSGSILLAHRGKPLHISSQASNRKLLNMHIDSMPPPQKKVLEDELRSDGADPDRLRHLYFSRWAYNIWAFPAYAEMNQPPEKFTRASGALF